MIFHHFLYAYLEGHQIGISIGYKVLLSATLGMLIVFYRTLDLVCIKKHAVTIKVLGVGISFNKFLSKINTML